MHLRLFVSGLVVCLVCTAAPKPLTPVSITADSSSPGNPPALVIDGDSSDRSRWLSAATAGPHWLQFDFTQTQTLSGLHLFSGYEGANPIRDFTVQFWRKSAWVEIPSATVTGNKAAAVALAFDDTVAVTTDKLRIWIITTPDNIARVSELVVWPASSGGVPPLPASATSVPAAPRLIFINQSGFDSGSPKRFTAPTLADDTIFEVRSASDGPALFTGHLHGHVGDFTAFEPTDNREYVVAVGSLVSDPFRVGPWWLERITYQGAVDFMIDSRHYVGNDRHVCRGSFGWRDDHHFGWELTTLVPQWISNPSAYARMPRQITYEAPKDPTLWGKLQPPAADAPDLVKLIHWGADIIVTQGLTHELMKSQLAYFLYAWPILKDYLPAQNYEVVRDFAFAHWADTVADRKYPYDESPEHDLLALKTKLGSTKGGYPPGFSIEPNLLLHEVALRQNRPDAGRYLDAAVQQAAWMVSHVDWNDPLATKGQRMSEFVTVTGLAHLLAKYPSVAPVGLADKLNDWAAVVIRRSDNLWDFRKLGDGPDQWTPMGEKPTMWNEPGNVVGLPAAILAALPFITDATARARLDQIVWSHFDGMFGRNPAGRHFSYAAVKEIEGVERGWYSRLAGGIGRLERVRFVLDGSPKNQLYPFHPEVGNIGWTEGWIQHNTPFNLSLAYLAHSRSQIEMRRSGDELLVRLTAPLNFDYAKVETGSVIVTSDSGDREIVTVTEESASSCTLLGRITLAATFGLTAKPGDGILSIRPADTLRATYGFGYLGLETSLSATP